MSNVTTAAIGDANLNYQPQTQPAQPAAPEAGQATDAADFRLVIEEDQATGSYVYKTLDRRTGEVIQQFPREEVLKLKDAQDYSAGSIVNARA